MKISRSCTFKSLTNFSEIDINICLHLQMWPNYCTVDFSYIDYYIEKK